MMIVERRLRSIEPLAAQKLVTQKMSVEGFPSRAQTLNKIGKQHLRALADFAAPPGAMNFSLQLLRPGFA